LAHQLSRRARQRHASPVATELLERRRLLSASLLKDINTTTLGNSDAAFADVNGVLVFSARAPEGRGLYRSDGTPAGTSKIAPLVGGALGFSPVFNGSLYFAADDGGGSGSELWKTDGTPAGTTRVIDLYPGTSGSRPGGFRVVEGELLFTAMHDVHGPSLWKTDGTAGGTKFVYDIDTANNNVSMTDLEIVGETVYFSTYESYTDPGLLWKSDPDFTSVEMVKSFRIDSSVGNLTPIGDRLLFSAIAPGSPYAGNSELWITDGTEANTHPIRGATAPSPIRIPLDFQPVGDAVYFTAFSDTTGREVYRTDGTEAGTVLVRDILPGNSTAANPDDLTPHQGGLYFHTSDATGPGLWRTDGTEAGTTLLLRAPVDEIVSSGDTVYFSTRRLGLWQTEGLWKSDGTQEGTVLVKEFVRGLPLNMTPYKGGVTFTADDGVYGYEPWYSDGTPEGTVLLKDLDQRGAASGPPAMSVSVGNKTIFTARDGSTAAAGGPFPLWVTDGTAGGTSRIALLPRAVGPASATAVLNGVAYFAESPLGSSAGRLWRSDGTADGTLVVAPTLRVEGRSIAELDGALYAIGRLDGENLPGLFRTDGTPEGTARVATLPQPGGGAPGLLATVGNTLYFTTTSGHQAQLRSQLWRSDATAAGTSQVFEFPAGVTGAQPGALANAGGKPFVVISGAFGAPANAQLWTSDGTAEGTVLLKRFASSIANPLGPDLVQVVVRGTDLFVAGAGEGDPGGEELWKSDGTVAGTVRVKDINPGSAGSSAQWLRAAGDRVFFSAITPATGRELWVTDGTDAGTNLVVDLRPGTAGSDPTVWGAAGGRVYFTATDGISGRELWSTDGTPAGTTLVHDVRPGAPGSNATVPLPIARPGGGLLFWADDGVHGSEPWTAPIAPQEPDTWLVGRHVFYNNSKFDGRDVAANVADDRAIATDKRALRPGGAFSFENVTSYSRGINGIMVDVSTRFDFYTDVRFSFKVGNDDSPGDWAAAPAPLAVARRIDGVPEDVERHTITWADSAIRNTWLEVTVEALFLDRVVATDVFYYGNLPGETGDATPAGRKAVVTGADVLRTRAAVPARTAPLTSAFDHNRDGAVNALDLAVARGNQTAALNAPTVPDASPAAALLGARGRPGRRSMLVDEIIS
jgi:ELWxxDGT repeat protein